MSHAAPDAPNDQRPSDTPVDERGAIEAVVAECIEALERGEHDPAARVCAARPELLPRVRRRLAQLAARGLIDGGDGPAPDTIGPYRIVRELGIGGMGVVYLAEQPEPVRRLVAVKIVKLGMDTREVVARFEKERQALALMSHPNIAQVFDAGITPAGRPYFVMEYVDGLGLLRFCDGRVLGPEERVRLLATVARAVHHAHERGFVHRDLKPSNVLVAEHAGVFVPKIIDFGIAKAITPTGGDDGSDGPRTRTDQLIGTPEYMSPEHAASGGLDVDARSDVYSLGAVLYELLCGEMPFDSVRLREAQRGEMERILHDELPTLPSRRLVRVADAAVRARGRERTALRRRIAGELDWITLKALAKEPDLRYATALALAEDLERWLRNDPVLAAPPARTYRLRKFVRRNRAAVAALAATIVIAGASWFVLSRAADDDRRLETAMGDANRLLAQAEDPRPRSPQDDAARGTLARDALARFDELLRERPHDVGLRKGRCQALIKLSQAHLQLGEIADAERTGREALADARVLFAERPDDVEARWTLAESARRAGRATWRLRRIDEAKPLFEEAVLHLDACFATAPTQSYGMPCSAAWRELSTALVKPAERGARVDALRRSAAVLVQLVDGGSIDPNVHRDLAISRAELAIRLVDAGRVDEADAELERAVAGLVQVKVNRGQAAMLVHRARAVAADKRGDHAAVPEHLIAATAAAEQWRSDEPGRLQPPTSLAALLEWLGEQQQRLRRFDDATATMQRGIELAEQMRRDFPSDPNRQRLLAATLRANAQALFDGSRRADLDRAHAWAKRASEEHGVAATTDPTQGKDAIAYGTLLLRIGDARGDDTRQQCEQLAKTLPSPDAPADRDAGHCFDAWMAVGRGRLRDGRVADAATALANAERFLGHADANEQAACDVAHLRSRVALANGDATAAADVAKRVLAASKSPFERWRAADCMLRAADHATGVAGATVWTDVAAQLCRAVVDDLAGDVAKDPLDPWLAIPWGFAGAQLAGITLAAGDRDAAQQLLAAAMPVLERIRDLAPRDVWPDDRWQQALALRDSLTAPR